MTTLMKLIPGIRRPQPFGGPGRITVYWFGRSYYTIYGHPNKFPE